jgi:hypothetical protein
MPGPLDTAYRNLIATCDKRRRLAEIGASPALQVSADRRCQQAFESLLGVVAGENVPSRRRPIARDAFRPAGRPAPEPAAPSDAGELTQPIGCAFAGTDRLLVLFPTAAVVLVRATGAPTALYRLQSGLQLLATGAEGRQALFYTAGHERFALLDLASGAWAHDFTPGFTYGAVDEVDEKARLLNVDEGWCVSLPDVVGYIDRYVGADNRYLWVTDKEDLGGIYSVGTGELQWDATRDDPEGEETGVLDAEGKWHPWRDGEADDYFEYEDEPVPPWARRPAPAVTLAEGGRFRLFDQGVVSHDGQNWFRIGFPVGASRFDAGGGALLLVARSSATIVTVAKRPRVERRVSFASLEAWLTDRRAPDKALAAP